jgi:hypothetical protein
MFAHSMILHTKLFGDNHQIVKLVNIIIAVKKKLPNNISLMHDLSILLAGIASKQSNCLARWN